MASLAVVCLTVVAGGLLLIFFNSNRLLSLIRPTKYRPAAKKRDDHVQVVVLGDLARSPRMRYHAISLGDHYENVDVVGYFENKAYFHSYSVTQYALAPQPRWLTWRITPFFIAMPFKLIHQSWTLFWTTMYETPAPKWIIVQNPPSIPTFHVLLIVSWFRGSKVLIDWHNYGHTILAVKAQNSWMKLPMKLLVFLYKKYEFSLGRRLGNAHLTVSHAMFRQLGPGGCYCLDGPVFTLHDRPSNDYRPIPAALERLKYLSKIFSKLEITNSEAQRIVDGATRLVVSSTSWTADEDFGLLLEALTIYAEPDPALAGQTVYPPLLVIITGKGPLKEFYMEKASKLRDMCQLRDIEIRSAWLDQYDYADLLACADLGISLHKSSSGVDLPMKVVDMFGAGLPVLAYAGFESFGELVKDRYNGLGFLTAKELANNLRLLLSRTEFSINLLSHLKQGALRESSYGWDKDWQDVLTNVFGYMPSPRIHLGGDEYYSDTESE